MEENYNNYIIYKAQNTFTGYSYIGATTKSVNDRKTDHVHKSNTKSSTYFQEEIATYGPEAFTWQQIDTAISTDELAFKEIKYIAEYDSHKNGYNSDKGGGFKKTVYRYNLDGSLSDTFKDLTTASDTIAVRKQDISRACWSVNNKLGDYLWSYDYVEPFIPNQDNRRKKVVQYLLNGTVLSQFLSVTEASKQTGISKTCISRCCRNERESSGGFLWQYS